MERIRERRRERMDFIKKWSFRFLMGVIIGMMGFGTVAYLYSPVTVYTQTTEVTCQGVFDKVQVDYENWGDSNAKYVLATIEQENVPVSGTPHILGEFYNRSLEFYITVFVNGTAYPTQSFVLRTNNESSVLCTNDVVVTFVFGIMGNAVIQVWAANLFITVVLALCVVFVLPICYILTWWWADDHWWNASW